jgi:hypothetical protein
MATQSQQPWGWTMCDHCGAAAALYCLQCGEPEHPDGYCYTGVYSAAVCYDCYIASRPAPPDEPGRGLPGETG